MPPGCLQVYRAGQGPPKSAEGNGGGAGQATLHHLSAGIDREVPADWRITNVTLICKKGWKKDPRNYRPVSLTLVLGKIMKGFIPSALTKHVKDS